MSLNIYHKYEEIYSRKEKEIKTPLPVKPPACNYCVIIIKEYRKKRRNVHLKKKRKKHEFAFATNIYIYINSFVQEFEVEWFLRAQRFFIGKDIHCQEK